MAGAQDIDDRLQAAADACSREGGRLTDVRRDVFRLILEADGPLGAYPLLDRLKQSKRNAVPPTVYRALDFLLQHGLIHRVERLNAFIPCTEEGSRHDHAAQLLICRRCGAVEELEDPAITETLGHAAAKRGFHPDQATVEVEGTCATCAAAR